MADRDMDDPGIEAVVFDVGETLLDDTREWGAWADWIGVPRHTFSAVLGVVTASGRDNAETFQYFRPGFDVAKERRLREEAGYGEVITDDDLYPDVRPALQALKDDGYTVGIAGNQTARAATLLRELRLPADFVHTSAEWAVAKPNPAFFERVAAAARCDPPRILYVGDHRDQDIVAATAAGFRAALVKRGPWGHLWADDTVVREHSFAVVDNLAHLVNVLRRIRWHPVRRCDRCVTASTHRSIGARIVVRTAR